MPFPERDPPDPASAPDRPPVAWCTVDRRGVIGTVRRATEGCIRHARSACVGASTGAVLPDPVRWGTLSGVEHSAREEDPVRLESYHPKSHQWLDGQIEPASEGIAVRFRDCTERTPCDELFHLLDVPVLHGSGRVRRDGTIATVNTDLARLFGYDHPRAVEGRALTFFGIAHTVWAEGRDASAEAGRVGPVHWQYSRTDDTQFFALTRITPIRDDDHRIQAYDLAVKEHKSRTSARNTDWMVERAVESTDKAVLVTEAAPLVPPGPSIVYVNASFTALTGYAKDEALGRTPKILYGPNTDVEVLESLQAHLQRGAPYRGELVAYKKDGTPYVAEWSVAPIRDENGAITHWMSVQSDVTSTLNGETVRPAHHSEAEALFAAIGDLLEASTPETVATELVRLTTETVGVSEAVVRRNAGTALVPIASSGELDATERVDLAGGHPAAEALRGECTATVDDHRHFGLGSHGTLSVTLSDRSAERPIPLLELLARHATTVLDRIAQAATDRTAHRRSDALRAASHALLDATTVSDGAQRAFEAVESLLPPNVGLGLVTFGSGDAGTRVLATNESSMMNWTRDRGGLVDAGLRRLAESGGRTLVERLSADPSTGIEERLRREGCRSVVAAPVASEDSRGLLLACADTEGAFSPDHRRLLQEVADLLGSALGRLSAGSMPDRTEEPSESGALKSALLANVHHELRTPLTSIIGFAEVISQEDDDVTSRFADLIARSGRRLQDTFNAFLTLSRLEAETLPMDPTPLSATAEVGVAVELFEERVHEAGLTIRYTAPDASVDVVLDPDGLHNILRHLLKNAITFTESGGTIHVELDATDDEVIVSIADSGIGMEPSEVPDLLAPFRQGSTRLDRPHQGAGLGLAVVHQWVDTMGGHLDIDTHVDKGTTVTVRLPRVLTSAP